MVAVHRFLSSALKEREREKKKEGRKNDSKWFNCRLCAPPVKLNENKQSRNYHSL